MNWRTAIATIVVRSLSARQSSLRPRLLPMLAASPSEHGGNDRSERPPGRRLCPAVIPEAQPVPWCAFALATGVCRRSCPPVRPKHGQPPDQHQRPANWSSTAGSWSTTATSGGWSGAPARCDRGHSVPALARELGESEWTVTKALATLGVVLPPRPERLARQRRRHAEDRIGARVATVGFADIRAYLEDRLIEQERLLVDVAAELAADRRTVRRLMQQVGVTRRRRTARQSAAGERGRQVQSVSWQSRRRHGWPSWA